MEHQHNTAQGQSSSGFILRHLLLLVVAVVILGVLYVESQSMPVVGTTAVLLLLAHVAAVVVILYGGRGILRTLFRRMHGQPEPHTDDHIHSHDLETEGKTIGWAWFYDTFTRILFSSHIEKMRTSAIKLANIQAGEKVLDIGCGTGTLAILAKQTSGQNAQIYGTDAAPEMIEHARQKAQNQGVDVNFQTGLAERIEFPDGSLDLVMNSLMMHHLTPQLREKALVEIYRVLKPGGRVLIVDFEPPKKGLMKAVLTLILGEMTSIDNTAIPPLLKAAGFSQVEIGATDTPIATYIMGIKE